MRPTENLSRYTATQFPNVFHVKWSSRSLILQTVNAIIGDGRCEYFPRSPGCQRVGLVDMMDSHTCALTAVRSFMDADRHSEACYSPAAEEAFWLGLNGWLSHSQKCQTPPCLQHSNQGQMSIDAKLYSITFFDLNQIILHNSINIFCYFHYFEWCQLVLFHKNWWLSEMKILTGHYFAMEYDLHSLTLLHQLLLYRYNLNCGNYRILNHLYKNVCLISWCTYITVFSLQVFSYFNTFSTVCFFVCLFCS